MPTIWHASDELRASVEAVPAECDPPARYGPKRIDQRTAFDGLIFRLRGGLQWNRLPAESGGDASVHRTFQRWVARGVLHRLWAVLVRGCEELGGVDRQWQAADCVIGKARHGGIRSDRAQPTGPSRA